MKRSVTTAIGGMPSRPHREAHSWIEKFFLQRVPAGSNPPHGGRQGMGDHVGLHPGGGDRGWLRCGELSILTEWSAQACGGHSAILQRSEKWLRRSLRDLATVRASLRGSLLHRATVRATVRGSLHFRGASLASLRGSFHPCGGPSAPLRSSFPCGSQPAELLVQWLHHAVVEAVRELPLLEPLGGAAVVVRRPKPTADT